MGDVRVIADRVRRRNRLPQLGQAHANLRAVDNTAQPGGLGSQDRQELVEPRLREALGRDPHLGVRMKSLEVGCLLFQEGHEWARAGVPGVAAGHEDRVDSRQLLEDLGPFGQRVFDSPGIGVIGIHGRIPDPDVEAVVGGDLGHPRHHFQGRQREVRAVGRVIGARRDQLDGVGAEDGQVADVSLPLSGVPGVVGIGLGAIAELVPAERIFGGGCQVESAGQTRAAATKPQLAEKPAHAEENSALIIADHRQDRRSVAAG